MKKRHAFLLSLILFATFVFRFPSLFEPYWYGDEGIFAAVATKLNQGGVLYRDAWDNKPPAIYLTYAGMFRTFGVSMFNLHLLGLIVVLVTSVVIYEIGVSLYGERKALFAIFIFGFLSSLRVVEGNLALTEIFMILPMTLAMFVSIKRKFDSKALFVSGILFAIASLYKQVGVLEATALGIFLLSTTKSFGTFVRKGAFLTVGFLIPYVLTVGYFASKHLVPDYIFGAYTYYRIYLGESPRYALLINILKFSPIVAAVTYGFWQRKRGELTHFHLLLLWTAFSFLGSYFSGRTYGHYMVQALPAVSLLTAAVSTKLDLTKARLAFAVFFFIPLIFLTKLLFTDFLSGGPINQIKYWQNFIEFSRGRKSVNAYNDFFDANVNTIMALSDFFKTQKLERTAFIWGEYSWLYAVSDLKNPSRYVTSFHVFGVPGGKEEVTRQIDETPPNYIIKPPRAIGYFAELEKILSEKYTLVSKIELAEVYLKK